MECICCICQLDGNYNFILVCCDLLELLIYVYVDNQVFWLIKNNIFGNYIFILKVIKEVLWCLMNDKCKMIGLCVLFNLIVLVLLDVLGELLMLIILMLLGNDFVELDLEEIKEYLGK